MQVNLSDSEWKLMNRLWEQSPRTIMDLTASLKEDTGWSKNTVHTYLTRMEAKGLVKIDRSSTAPYSAAAAREDCARQERDELLNKVYGGAAGDLIAAFLKETHISADEAARLRRMLDEMEV